jgi:hypothetical protein
VRAIAGKLAKEVIERHLWVVLCSEPRQAIAAMAGAMSAGYADDDVWVLDTADI